MCCRSLRHLVVKHLPVRNVNGDFSLERRRRRLARAHLNQVSVACLCRTFHTSWPSAASVSCPVYFHRCIQVRKFRTKVRKNFTHGWTIFPSSCVWHPVIGQNGQRSVSHGPIDNSGLSTDCLLADDLEVSIPPCSWMNLGCLPLMQLVWRHLVCNVRVISLHYITRFCHLMLISDDNLFHNVSVVVQRCSWRVGFVHSLSYLFLCRC